MKKAIITGAEGFIGSHLTEELLKNDYMVFALIKPGATLTKLKNLKINKIEEKITTQTPNLEIMNCDMLDLDKIEEIIKDVKPDVIYHFAAQPYVKPSWEDPIYTFKTNIISTTKILETVKKNTPKTKIILACSSAAYGTTTNKKQALNEDDALMAIHPYGISKAAIELISRQYNINFGLDTINLRFFNQTGPRKENDACSDFARTIAKIELGLKEPIIEAGNINTYRDITGIKDTIQAIMTATEKGKPGETYNVCSNVKTRIRDVLEYLTSLSNKKITIKENTKEKLRSTDEDVILGDNTKIKNIGYTPKQDLKELLKEMLNYWKEYYNKKQAVILAGGLGTRLRPIITNTPKPMAEFNKKPFLEYQIEKLKNHVDEIIICIGYKGEIIKNYFGDGSKFGIKIIYSEELNPLGTGGALRNASQLIDNDKPFIHLNGDTYIDMDFRKLIEKHERSGIKHAMIITETENPTQVGIVRINNEGIITEFREKPQNPTSEDKYMNAGLCILNPEFLKEIPKGIINLEKEIFPKLIQEGMRTEEYKGYYVDIGTPKNYEKFKKHTEN